MCRRRIASAFVQFADVPRFRHAGWEIVPGELRRFRRRAYVLMERPKREAWWLRVRDRLAAALKGLRS